MLGGVAAVHPEAGGIVGLAFLHDFGDVVALTALVACAPNEYAGVVAVAQDHPADALAVHLRELGHVADILGGMGLVTGLVDDEDAVLVCKV